MKVRSNLKAGNVLDSLNNTAQTITRPVTNFLSQADREARNLTGSVTNTVSSAWNSVTSLVR